MRMTIQRAVAFAIAAGSVGACTLDLENPNSPTETQVTTSVDGVIALATGLQGRFAQSYGNFAYMAGLVTDEFASTSAALVSISDAEQGAVPSGTTIADNVFNSVYRTVRTADDLLAGSDALGSQFAIPSLDRSRDHRILRAAFRAHLAGISHAPAAAYAGSAAVVWDRVPQHRNGKGMKS